MKNFFSYIIVLLFPVVIAVALSVSCSEMQDDASVQDDDDVSLMVVSGTVRDKNSNSPIDSIMIVLSAYSEHDTMKKFPLKCDTTFTSRQGEYMYIHAQLVSSRVYNLRAIDVDGAANGGSYHPAILDLNVDWDGPSYDVNSNTYRLDGLDFYLSTDAASIR